MKFVKGIDVVFVVYDFEIPTIQQLSRKCIPGCFRISLFVNYFPLVLLNRRYYLNNTSMAQPMAMLNLDLTSLFVCMIFRGFPMFWHLVMCHYYILFLMLIWCMSLVILHLIYTGWIFNYTKFYFIVLYWFSSHLKLILFHSFVNTTE
jgi:hypothetical protein